MDYVQIGCNKLTESCCLYCSLNSQSQFTSEFLIAEYVCYVLMPKFHGSRLWGIILLHFLRFLPFLPFLLFWGNIEKSQTWISEVSIMEIEEDRKTPHPNPKFRKKLNFSNLRSSIAFKQGFICSLMLRHPPMVSGLCQRCYVRNTENLRIWKLMRKGKEMKNCNPFFNFCLTL